jgi:hypothetical protein
LRNKLPEWGGKTACGDVRGVTGLAVEIGFGKAGFGESPLGAAFASLNLEFDVRDT